MKLLKLNTDHYVVVDDSEIKESDYVLSKLNEIVVFGKDYTPSLYRRITHSTQPIEYSSKIGKYWGRVQPIELSEVKELLGEVDAKITDIAFKAYQKQDTWTWTQFQDIFPLGYNQALEDNKEKKYTEEDMRKAWNAAYIDAMSIDEETYKPLFFEDFIESLQPKTEWEVEFINGKLTLI